jgi:hypothetical protein
MITLILSLNFLLFSNVQFYAFSVFYTDWSFPGIIDVLPAESVIPLAFA